MEEDMENYMRFTIMGGYLHSKKHVVPHIFNCQPTRSAKTLAPRGAVSKRNAARLVADALDADALEDAVTCIDSKCSHLKDLEDVTGSQATGIGLLEGDGPQNLHMVCREETKMVLEWDQPPIPQNSVPVYVLEVRSKDFGWRPLTTTPWTMHTAQNLTSYTEYMFQVRTVVAEGQIGETVTSPWVATLKDGFTPQVIQNIRLHPGVVVENGGLIVHIVWEPASDKTCHYEAIMWTGHHRHIHNETLIVSCSPSTTAIKSTIKCPKSSFEMEFKTLAYRTEYSMDLMSQSGDKQRESKKARFSFTTPTCYEANNRNGSSCLPDQPGGVAVNETTNDESKDRRDVTVSWRSQFPTPTEYLVELVTGNIVLQRNVSGNHTQAVFQSAPVARATYHVTVQGVSPAGVGPKASWRRRYTAPPPPPPQPPTDTSQASSVNAVDANEWSHKASLAVGVGTILLLLFFAGSAYVFFQRHFVRTTREKSPSIEASFYHIYSPSKC